MTSGQAIKSNLFFESAKSEAERAGARVPGVFSSLTDEYGSARDRVGVHDRRYRGILEIRGKDRSTWLHNFVTQRIEGLADGSACYLFTCNVQGRILFDGIAMMLPDAIWLDVELGWMPAAFAHLDKYHVTEDVEITDRTADFARIAVIGPGIEQLLGKALPAPDEQQLFGIQNSAVAGMELWALRHDLIGAPAVDLIVPSEMGDAVWKHLRSQGAAAVGLEAVQIRRIEAGMPWSMDDIDDTVLPAETGQFARAVSINKGCYLGQEIIERMRSRDSVARRLVGLRAEGGARLSPGAELRIDNQAVGRITSACDSIAVGASIGMGYVKSSHAETGKAITAAGEATVKATIVTLPLS